MKNHYIRIIIFGICIACGLATLIIKYYYPWIIDIIKQDEWDWIRIYLSWGTLGIISISLIYYFAYKLSIAFDMSENKFKAFLIFSVSPLILFFTAYFWLYPYLTFLHPKESPFKRPLVYKFFHEKPSEEDEKKIKDTIFLLFPSPSNFKPKDENTKKSIYNKKIALISKKMKEANSVYFLSMFERGIIIPLGNDIYLSPYPTDEEFKTFILNGDIASIVSLLDANDPEDQIWIYKEEKLTSNYRIQYINYPWSSMKNKEKLSAIKRIKYLPKPIIIHEFIPFSYQCRNFIQIFSNEDSI